MSTTWSASAPTTTPGIVHDEWAARRPGSANPASGSRLPAAPDALRRVQRLQSLANLMDSAIRVPGTQFRFGLDPLLGLAPGIGDLVSSTIALYIVYEGWKLGATGKQLAMMIANVLIDGLIGTVPVAGDLADFAFKANRRNLAILGIEPMKQAF